MRDRKLLDQTLPVKAAGTLVSPSARYYDLAAAKSRKFCLHSSRHSLRSGFWHPLSRFTSIPIDEGAEANPPSFGERGVFRALDSQPLTTMRLCHGTSPAITVRTTWKFLGRYPHKPSFTNVFTFLRQCIGHLRPVCASVNPSCFPLLNVDAGDERRCACNTLESPLSPDPRHVAFAFAL